jgi:hypothetical protein
MWLASVSKGRHRLGRASHPWVGAAVENELDVARLDGRLRNMDHLGEPESLAEALAQGHGRCPIPATHDRLNECHYWWHEMARNYHEPNQFRWSLGAFVQAARSVTLMLQAEKRSFQDFQWYTRWQSKAQQEPLLQWINNTRVQIFHQSALATNSWARFTCLFKKGDPRARKRDPDDWDDDYSGPINVQFNPFLCTHYYIVHGIAEDHPHEYLRHWEIDSLPNQELLEACANVLDLLQNISQVAHAQAGAESYMARRDLPITETSRHAYPCMNDTLKYRTVRTKLKNGIEVWKNQPTSLHSFDSRSNRDRDNQR